MGTDALTNFVKDLAIKNSENRKPIDDLVNESEAKEVVEKALYDELHSLITSSEEMQFLHNHIKFLIHKAGLKDEIESWDIEITIHKKV